MQTVELPDKLTALGNVDVIEHGFGAHRQSLVLVTCRQDQAWDIARMFVQRKLDKGRCILVTSGDPVAQKGSNGAINLLIALGGLLIRADSLLGDAGCFIVEHGEPVRAHNWSVSQT